jgi:uncharacterized integral membrane protein (TIGR00697 family)
LFPGALAHASAATQPRVYRYYDLVMAAFVTVLLCSNIIGSTKVCTVGGFTFGAGILFFPVSYIFGDILTEVYGYAYSRRVVWAGFGALGFASLLSFIVVSLPPAASWNDQDAYARIIGSTPRIALSSLLAFWAGEFLNSYVLAKLKVRTGGRFLWLRAVASTIAGQGVDTLVFYPVAFGGLWSVDLLLRVMIGNYLIKVAWEALATPITYKVVGFLKAAEQVDHYDRDTDFTPFSLQT